MRRIEAGQLEFGVGLENSLMMLPGPIRPVFPEREYRVDSLITLSDIEKIIYRDIEGIKPKNALDAGVAIGSAIDWALVPANFIYRYRDDYCFPEYLYPNWDLETVFSRFYPTGWDFQEFLTILQSHRQYFYQTLSPANSALEIRNIKRGLIPIWQEVAKKFELDRLHLQGATDIQGNHILPSGKTASPQTVLEIGQRIVRERFDTLTDDDKNYTYIAKPDCLLTYDLEGQTYHIQVQPDYIKRLRERRKSVKKRQVVIKRIVGDFKDSDRRDLEDYDTAYGKTMLVYNFLLLQIGEKFKQNQLTYVRLANRQVRRVFLIPQEIAKPTPRNQVQTALEFLQEEGDEIFTPMPTLTEEHTRLAREIFEKSLLISRQPVNLRT